MWFLGVAKQMCVDGRKQKLDGGGHLVWCNKVSFIARGTEDHDEEAVNTERSRNV